MHPFATNGCNHSDKLNKVFAYKDKKVPNQAWIDNSIHLNLLEKFDIWNRNISKTEPYRASEIKP